MNMGCFRGMGGGGMQLFSGTQLAKLVTVGLNSWKMFEQLLDEVFVLRM